MPSEEDSHEKPKPLNLCKAAYKFYYQSKTLNACKSFDILPKLWKDASEESYPLSMTLVYGTETENNSNEFGVLRLSNINEEKVNTARAAAGWITVPHPARINKIRATVLDRQGHSIAACWSDDNKMTIWDISTAVLILNNYYARPMILDHNDVVYPMFSYHGNMKGSALSWSPFIPGVLATGDSSGEIHILEPLEEAEWDVSRLPLVGHRASVCDVQWSPTKKNILASCSEDKSIKIWDARLVADKACVISRENAHSDAVHIIDWNKINYLLVSAGLDNKLKLWDVRKLSAEPICTTNKHHRKTITSVEWHPTNASIVASADQQQQICMWNLGSKANKSTNVQRPFQQQSPGVIRELHWYRQKPGVLLTVTSTNFNIFRAKCVQ